MSKGSAASGVRPMVGEVWLAVRRWWEDELDCCSEVLERVWCTLRPKRSQTLPTCSKTLLGRRGLTYVSPSGILEVAAARLPGDEGRSEAKKPPALAVDLLDMVGDRGVPDVGLLDAALTDERRAGACWRAGSERCAVDWLPSKDSAGSCEAATREGSAGAPVKVMVGLVPDELRWGGWK